MKTLKLEVKFGDGDKFIIYKLTSPLLCHFFGME